MRHAFFFQHRTTKKKKIWSCQKVSDALYYRFDTIFIRVGSRLYRQIVGIPMSTDCALLLADSFLYYYEREFMLLLSDNNQSGVIEVSNSTLRYSISMK